MTPTEILQKSYDALIAQGEPAIVITNSVFYSTKCVYRTDKGLGCAVGVLLDDDTAKLWDTCTTSDIVNIINNFEVDDWINDNVELLSKMQDVHDNYVDSYNWNSHITEGYVRIAKLYNLELKL